MKQFLTAIAFLLSAATGLAQPAANKISVVSQNGKFTINKVNVTDGWDCEPVLRTLGINERKRDGYNITHTYDDYGIVLFELADNKVATGILTELQFFIAAGDTNAVTPTGFFSGKMVIEKLKISDNLSWEQVKEKLKGFKLTTSYIEHNYRLSYKGLYFYFQFNKEETILLKISVGKDKNK